jgi:multiple sugar transport system substrate-binding protein
MTYTDIPDYLRSHPFDVATIVPSHIPDMASESLLQELDIDLHDTLPAYSEQGVYGGKRFGVPDDGDVWILYYRKDIFDKLGIEPPTTAEQFDTVGALIAEATDIAGSAQARRGEGSNLYFEYGLREAGGAYFDKDMKATVNSDIAYELIQRWLDQESWMVSRNARLDVYGTIKAYLAGDAAMLISWPPFGRFAAGISQDSDAFATMPRPTAEVREHTGYALVPGTGQLAV